MPVRTDPLQPSIIVPPPARPAAPAVATATERVVAPTDAFITGGRAPQLRFNRGRFELDGRASSDALVTAAHALEAGKSPFTGLSAPQRKQLIDALIPKLTATTSSKESAKALLERSAATSLLLAASKGAPAELRDQAVAAYVAAMGKEKRSAFQASMYSNLQASGLRTPASSKATLDKVTEAVLPPRPPYEKWFKNGNELNVRHYVMDEFWREELSGYRQRGFQIVNQTATSAEAVKELKDPTGQNPPVKTRVKLFLQEDNVLRDMDDPKVQMVIYSGHSSYGGVMDASLAKAPHTMAGTKLVTVLNCRGKQNAGDLFARYPGVHLTHTFASAYGDDDQITLNETFDMIARRGSYADVRKNMRGQDLIQPLSNYVLPDDQRTFAFRDGDRDGVPDASTIGGDKLFDPTKKRARAGALDFRPQGISTAPQLLGGEKLNHAVGFANTMFYYFAEANRQAPLTKKQADSFVSGGWYSASSDEPLRITDHVKDGKTTYEIAYNTKYSGRSRDVLAAYTLMEMQKHLSEKEHGRFTEDDKLRGMVLLGNYGDLFLETSDDMEAMLKSMGARYGLEGVDYDKVFGAMGKDGHDLVASRAALDYLKAHGVRSVPNS